MSDRVEKELVRYLPLIHDTRLRNLVECLLHKNKLLYKQLLDNVKIIGVHNMPSKFIAIYGDGSGCAILKRWCNTYFVFVEDEEQNHCTIDDIEDAGFVFFVSLPDNFKTLNDDNE